MLVRRIRERTRKQKIVLQVPEQKAQEWERVKQKLLDLKLEIEEESLIDFLLKKVEKEIEIAEKSDPA